ncbi:DL-glycerol-3-phosphatase [Diaporthe australafricana]|uniref:DL-glycerol-3-phosphatase n=1 Tax=Diaporthe australafricana TaxID=127596 RepID=A0ABR3WF11_9PEZI
MFRERAAHGLPPVLPEAPLPNFKFASHISERRTLLTNELSKPDPACYTMGLERIGMARDDENTKVLVLEDSPAGIKAGKAAGCKVLGLVTSHTVEQVKAAEPDWIVKDLDSVQIVEAKDGLVTLEFSNGLAEPATENGDSTGA